MKKRDLEKAVELFDSIPGAELVDNYFAKLYKEELDELEDFLKFTSDDIKNMYKNDKVKAFEYVQDVKKTYLVQLSEIHQCIITLVIEYESTETIIDTKETDIVMQFRSFEKSTWTDQFIIKGAGVHGGINLDEYNDWLLLLKFLLMKKRDSAKFTPSRGQILADKIDSAIQNVEEEQ